jgi:predicted methyltransferase
MHPSFARQLPPGGRPARLAQRLAAAALAALLGACASAPPQARDDGLDRWAAAEHRSPANVARDAHRHPVETLRFFGVRADSTVVEILPGSAGYYLEILAPWLREKGRYLAAGRDETAPPRYRADHERMVARLAAQPQFYDRVTVTKFNGDRHDVAPPGSADFVLTFRNLHNWMERGEAQAALRAFHRALKPGGVLGIVDHRARTDLPEKEQMRAGYVRQDTAIALVESAGFRLVASSEVNANPRDGRSHPEGVWTLPPSYRLGDRDRERYRAIGESDRFTLKFVKR